MINSKKFFPLIFATIISVAATSSLRTAGNDNHKRSRSLEDGFKRYVIGCTSANFVSMDDCVSTMQGIAPVMEINHRLKMINAIAVTMSLDEFNNMNNTDYEIEEDPERSIPVTVESSRKLNQQTSFGIDMVRARESWDEFGVRGEGIRVCVMDSGLFSAHSDLTSSKISGYNGPEAFTPWNRDGLRHGTHVTGIIAAADNNGGVVGVAPDVEIYVVRVFDNNGRFFGSDVTAAAEICKDAGARIINMSLGGGRPTRFESSVFDLLAEEGIVSIAAAGNSGNTQFSYPASYPAVISVAAVDSNRNLASFSQRNSGVDVAGPGVNILSLDTNNSYRFVSGTSQATPHVAGVVALMMSYNASIPIDSIVTALEDTANHPEMIENDRTDSFGHGIVDAFAALTLLRTKFPQAPPTASPISPVSTPSPTASPMSPVSTPSTPSSVKPLTVSLAVSILSLTTMAFLLI